MEPVVHAGAIEFSPAEIALVLAVLTVLSLLVTAPGWVTVAIVLGRRPAGAGRRWAARAGGGLLGLAISAAVALPVGALLDDHDWALVPAVVAGWLGCWGAAVLLRRPLRTDHGDAGSGTAGSRAAGSAGGWGR